MRQYTCSTAAVQPRRADQYTHAAESASPFFQHPPFPAAPPTHRTTPENAIDINHCCMRTP